MSTTFESVDPDHHAIPCFFLEIDLHTGGVTEQLAVFPYRNLDRVQIGYDAFNNMWIMALEATVKEKLHIYRRKIFDLYEIVCEAHDPWQKLLRLEDAKGEDKRLVTFWQHEQFFPLLFAGYYEGALSGLRLYWRSWRASNSVKPRDVRLPGKSFFEVPYLFDETFLLFTGEYQRRRRQWRFRIAAYTRNGTRIHHQLVPRVSFPARREDIYAAVDLWDWLWPTIRLTQGPRFGAEGRQTCVAALLLKEQLEQSPAWEKGRLPRIDHGLPPVQGGLYWVDQEGHILRHEASLLGEQISMCLCGEMIVGTDLLDGQQRLWSWSPVEAMQRRVRAVLAPDTERVTLVAMEGNQHEAASSFGV